MNASLFTYVLTEEARRASDDTSFEDLMRRVGNQVDDYAQTFYGARQQPRAEGGHQSKVIGGYLND